MELNLSLQIQYIMTRLGLYLTKKSVNRAMVSRRTGISQARLSQLCSNESTKLRSDELYLIALAIDIDPGEMIIEIHKDLNVR